MNFCRSSAVAGRCLNPRTASRTPTELGPKLFSWPGIPERWLRASSKVTCCVAYASGRTKSAGIIVDRGVVHPSLSLLAKPEAEIPLLSTGISSSISKETAADVNDFVVLAAK
jgi:hypothetical protein